MSRENRALADAPKRFVKSETIVEETVSAEPADVDNIEVTDLQIDDSQEIDCDPYNSTGQFLAEALKSTNDA